MAWTAERKLGWLGVAVSAAFWPGMLSAAWTPRWAVLAVGLPLTSRLDPRALPQGAQGVLVFMLALGALSLIASPYPQAGAYDLINIAILCMAFLAGANVDSLDPLFTGLCWGLAVSVGIAIIQALGVDWAVDLGNPADTHANGLFFSSEVLAEFAALLAVWAVLRHSWTWAAIAAVPLVLCASRVAFIVAGVGVLLGFRPSRPYLFRTLLLVGVVAAIAAATMLSSDTYKIGSAGTRLVIWGATALSAADAPLGNGLGWFIAAHPYEMLAHSDALQALVELGIGSVVLLAIPYMVWRSGRGSDAERALFYAACVAVVFSFPLHFPASGFLTAVLAGFLVGGRHSVCVGQPHLAAAHGAGARWGDAHYPGIARAGYRSLSALSARSLLAGNTTLRADTDRGGRSAFRRLPSGQYQVQG